MSICPRCIVRSKARSPTSAAPAWNYGGAAPSVTSRRGVCIRTACAVLQGQLEMLDRGAIEDDRALEPCAKRSRSNWRHAFYQRASRDRRTRCCRTVRRLPRWSRSTWKTLSKLITRSCQRPRRTSRWTRSNLRRRRRKPEDRQPVPHCHRLRAARSRFFTNEGEQAPPGRSSASCTASWPPRSANTSRC